MTRQDIYDLIDSKVEPAANFIDTAFVLNKNGILLIVDMIFKELERIDIEDYEMLASENKFFAEWIEARGYNSEEISKIACGSFR